MRCVYAFRALGVVSDQCPSQMLRVIITAKQALVGSMS